MQREKNCLGHRGGTGKTGAAFWSSGKYMLGLTVRGLHGQDGFLRRARGCLGLERGWRGFIRADAAMRSMSGSSTCRCPSPTFRRPLMGIEFFN